MQYLREHCTAFRQTIARLYEQNSGNFLELKITFAKFDPTMQRRVQCITINETNESNLGFSIENKPISIMEFQVKMNKCMHNVILRRVRTTIATVEKNITYSECVLVALGIQHAMRMRLIVICRLPVLQHFSTLSHGSQGRDIE
jgi:hypothetical protein